MYISVGRKRGFDLFGTSDGNKWKVRCLAETRLWPSPPPRDSSRVPTVTCCVWRAAWLTPCGMQAGEMRRRRHLWPGVPFSRNACPSRQFDRREPQGCRAPPSRRGTRPAAVVEYSSKEKNLSSAYMWFFFFLKIQSIDSTMSNGTTRKTRYECCFFFNFNDDGVRPKIRKTGNIFINNSGREFHLDGILFYQLKHYGGHNRRLCTVLRNTCVKLFVPNSTRPILYFDVKTN